MNVDEVIDRLYGLPPEEFTQARSEAERELRKAGQREKADQVKALRKPTAAAGAVNRLVRSHRAEVEKFLEAAASLRDAQVAGKGDLAEAARAERIALNELVALGGESVRATLEAAAVDDGIARDLLAARLVREPQPAGFGTMLAYADPAAATAASRKRATSATRGQPNAKAASAEARQQRAPTATKPDDSAARARLAEAKQTLTAAEAEERQARRRWEQTQRQLEKARAASEKAQGELDRIHRR